MHRHDAYVDPIEAQEVVRLAAERHSDTDSGPTVNGLAEALGLPRDEVERLLAEVRARRKMVEPRRRLFGDGSAALSAALALTLLLVTAGGLLVYRAQVAPVGSDIVATGGFDTVQLPPALAPSAPPIIIPDVTALDTEAHGKHREVERLAAEIARIHAEQAREDAERSSEDLDRTIQQLRAELEKLNKK